MLSGKTRFSPDQPPVLEDLPSSARARRSVLPFGCAGSSPALALAEAVCPALSQLCHNSVEHGAQRGLSARLGLTDRMACAAASRQGWWKGKVYGRSNVLCWVPFPQLETE